MPQSPFKSTSRATRDYCNAAFRGNLSKCAGCSSALCSGTKLKSAIHKVCHLISFAVWACALLVRAFFRFYLFIYLFVQSNQSNKKEHNSRKVVPTLARYRSLSSYRRRESRQLRSLSRPVARSLAAPGKVLCFPYIHWTSFKDNIDFTTAITICKWWIRGVNHTKCLYFFQKKNSSFLRNHWRRTFMGPFVKGERPDYPS